MGNGEHSEPIVLARAVALKVGRVRVEPAYCLLRADDGREENVEPRVMQVLVALVRAGGAPVSRDELIDACWSGRVVSSDAITRVISILRKLAKDIGGGSFAVETLNKVGYRLTAAADEIAPGTATPTPARFAPDRRAVLALGTAAGLTALGAGWLAWRPKAVAHPVSGEQTLIVPPFTAAPDLAQIAQATSDSIRDDLVRVPGMRVIGGLTSQAASLEGLSAAQVGARTGATLALTARLDRRADGLHLVPTLTDLKGGAQLWSDRIDGSQESVSDLARDAAGALIEQLVLILPVVPMSPADRSLRGDPEAYRLSAEARARCDDIRELLLAGKADEAQALADRAAELVERARAIDPEHPAALVVLAEMTRNGWSSAIAAKKLTTQQRVEQARGLLQRALRSDPRSADAMTGVADIYRRFGWRWDDAETLFRHALVNDPANADAHWAYSHELATLGRARDGLDHTLALMAIDHSHLWRRITLPRMLYCFGRRDEAIEAYFRELGALPGNPFLLWEIYYLFAAEGSRTGLQSLSETLARLGGEHPPAVAAMAGRSRAAIDAMAGRPESLLAILDAERESLDAGTLTHATLGGRARDDIGFILAIEYACAGRYDQAIALLDQALEAMSVYWVPSLPYGSAPFPAAMQADPRFRALWQRDPRMADAVQRRRQAAATWQMATIWPDGRVTRPGLDATLNARVAAAMALLPARATT